MTCEWYLIRNTAYVPIFLNILYQRQKLLSRKQPLLLELLFINFKSHYTELCSIHGQTTFLVFSHTKRDESFLKGTSKKKEYPYFINNHNLINHSIKMYLDVPTTVDNSLYFN